MKKIGIYKITSPSGKIYIGQSIDIENRQKMYRLMHCKYQTKIYNSIKKYGWENHFFEIIHECSQEELNELEKYYINLFNTFNNDIGLNLRSGGYRGALNDDAKKRIGEAQKGKTVSLETRNKISESNKKRKWSKESIEKRTQTRKENGYKHSEETIKKMTLAQKGKPRPNCRKPRGPYKKQKLN